MTPELKSRPCPFCGAPAGFYDNGVAGCVNRRCEAWGANAEFYHVPIDAWNRRTPDLTEALARLKALEEEVRAEKFNEPGTPMWYRALASEWADEVAAIRKALGGE